MDVRAIYESIPNAPQCHCSMLHKFLDGTLICAFFAGSHEKARDVAIYASFGDETGSNWSQPRKIANTVNRSNGSPVFYETPDGKLFLFYHAMHHGRFIEGGWSVVNIRYKTSNNNGKSWDDWRWLRRNWFWVLRCRPYLLENGSVILPVHREMFKYKSFFYINSKPDLNGRWTKTGYLDTPNGCLEPSVCSLGNGNLLCSLRTKDKLVYFSRSEDYGHSWSEPEPSGFKNPSSQTDIYRTRSGKIVLVLNDREQGRYSLSYAISEDNGYTWSESKIIAAAPQESPEYGAGYSYPSIIELNNGNILVSYTHLRRQIYRANLGKI